MKIEMGESLFYSWLRHIKGCQVVQTNWKSSSHWELSHKEELAAIFTSVDCFFREKHGYQVFKKNSSVFQFIRQGESDALGAAFRDGAVRLCAVDVAFHEDGLQYGSREETVCKIISKSIRTAMCLYGYFGVRQADIIFASPKINPSVMNDVAPCIEELQQLTTGMGYGFSFRILANDAFRDEVVAPMLAASGDIADTNELFLRSCQLLKSSGIQL